MRSAGVAAILALATFGTLASSTPTLDASVCVSTDKACVEPIEGLPVEAYLMNADSAWAAAGPVVDNLTASARASSDTHVSAFGHEADAEASTQASTKEPPHGPAQDGRTHYFACPSSDACPDLTVDVLNVLRNLAIQSAVIAPGDCNVAEGNTEPGHRWLLRFTTSSPNHGDADVVLGSPLSNPSQFEWGTCHNHWHFNSYGQYRLWEPAAYAAWRELRASNPNATASELLAAHPELDSERVGHKQGFCVIDVTRYQRQGGNTAKYTSCYKQGISMGWADTYSSGLDGQFIDITGLPAGHYVLEVEVNTERVIEEAAYDNDFAAVWVVLPPLPGL